MAFTPQNLPSELIDLIAGHISQIPNDLERIHALASMALVCQFFRQWAQALLFRRIELQGIYMNIDKLKRRLRALADIIQADPNSESSGVASHIQSFNILVTVLFNSERPLLESVIDQASLPIIFKKIFRTGSHHRSLSIYLFTGSADTAVDWTLLKDDLRDAILQLCKSPHLKTLHLHGLLNLPSDILLHSQIRHIDFRMISLNSSTAESSSLAVNDEDNITQLESLVTDFSFSVHRLLDHTPSSPTPLRQLLRSLKSLKVIIENEEELLKTPAVLHSALSLEKVEIRASYFGRDINLLHYNNLLSLKYLRIVAGPTPLSDRDFLSVRRILGQSNPPPGLREISVAFKLSAHKWSGSFSTFNRFNFAPLDATLTRFQQVGLVVIQLSFAVKYRASPNGAEGASDFDRGKYVKEATVYFLTKFPLLSERSSGMLRLNIDAHFRPISTMPPVPPPQALLTNFSNT